MSGIMKLSRLGTREKLDARLAELELALPIEDEVDPGGPLAQPIEIAGRRVGNRFAVLPMEGWDATLDGRPTDLVRRRWSRFGQSGAKLVWGGEAYAIEPAGRANPNQLCANPASKADLAELRETLASAHVAAFGRSDDLMIGLQLTHSGRFSRPAGTPLPRVAFRHPVLDARVGVESDEALLSDVELDDLVVAYGRIAGLARDAGFDFVDVKACHGYLGHELLSARERPGAYGGDFEGRTRFLRGAIRAVRSEAPELGIGARLSVFDLHPFKPNDHGVGEPEPSAHRPFGAAPDGLDFDLGETHRLLDSVAAEGVSTICTTAGSPYYNPHIQRPAFYPPSDGYGPPEDPLVGVDRQLRATAAIKARHPALVVVGSGYTYLQDWLPRIAQAVVRQGGADLIGLGRMMLSYPGLPRDVLTSGELERALVCRTFSDCTTAPRHGLVSGCYPIDPEYKRRPEALQLAALKKAAKGRGR